MEKKVVSLPDGAPASLQPKEKHFGGSATKSSSESPKDCYYCGKIGRCPVIWLRESPSVVTLAAAEKDRYDKKCSVSSGSSYVKVVALVSTLGDSPIDVSLIAVLSGYAEFWGCCEDDVCENPNLGTYNAFLSQGTVTSCENVKRFTSTAICHADGCGHCFEDWERSIGKLSVRFEVCTPGTCSLAV